MSRNITVLGLVQMLLVILGFFGLGIVMKMNGYPHEEMGIRWNSLALWLRQHGLILLLVPVIWAAVTAVAQHRQRFLFPYGVWAALGIVFALATICVFLSACVDPFHRPLFNGG
jgi:hypothetical protein